MPQLDPRMGEIYKYYQGGDVKVLSLCTGIETGERLVVYQELFGRYDIYATHFSRFVGEVDIKKHPACAYRFKFTYQERDDLGIGFEKKDVRGPKLQKISETPDNNFREKEPGEAGPVKNDGDKSISELMIDFLDERDFEKKEEILAEMEGNKDLSDGIIDNLAAALDIVIDEGPLDKRFTQLRFCVRTRARFENNRLRQ